ncbi:MAG: ATP-binding protein [bacterium]|nr:ATP-binding protein [bacterium]
MFGKIKYITEGEAHVESLLQPGQDVDLMNNNVVFEAENQRILGEIEEVNDNVIKIRFLGEFIGDKYISGVISKPVMSSTIRQINNDELKSLMGIYSDKTFILGKSAIYKGNTVYVDINDLLSNHMAIFGNSGSGKSCGVARMVQNLFSNPNFIAYNANIFIFDAYGEYKTAFSKLNEINPNYSYKFITTNPTDATDQRLAIPVHLLTLDDMTLLLQVSSHTQIPIIERALKLAKIFADISDEAAMYKNHLIAKALLAILFSNETTKEKKNEIFQVIQVCHTNEFNFDTDIPGVGYTRKFSECFEIDSHGNFGESVLINEYILKFINDDLEGKIITKPVYYTLKDFASALEFTLISEGFLHNDAIRDDASILKVRLNSILNSSVGTYFNYPNYITLEQYIASLVATGERRKAQIININLEDMDDTYAKVIVKIYARMFFEFAKTRTQRASIPFHLFLEEAHRYVSKDMDTFLLGYNIFERIAKEGRKYGVLLNIISQRPVEISDTVISQCSNFLIFKMTHPKDIEYIRTMLPNISQDVIEKQKVLQPGNCVGFGGAFKLPMIIKLEMPNPMPYSTNCDVNQRWRIHTN